MREKKTTQNKCIKKLVKKSFAITTRIIKRNTNVLLVLNDKHTIE